MENDLISRSALLDELQEELDFDTPMYDEEQNKFINTGLRIAVKDVKRQPAVDAVEVVRCKECKHCVCLNRRYRGDIACSKLHTDNIYPDFYCGCGERRDAE